MINRQKLAVWPSSALLPHSSPPVILSDLMRVCLLPISSLRVCVAVLTTWLGLHFGLVVTHRKNHSYRLKHWTALSTVFFALGWVISPFWGMNKQVPSHTPRMQP